MIDAPGVEESGEDITELTITPQNAEELLQQINAMNSR
jgi:hypothetical protein